jgi:predicted outer membrane lipoprotein
MNAIGYELVEGLAGKVRGMWSFRILLCGQPVKDAQTPLWFEATESGKRKARACAEDYMKALGKHLVKRMKSKRKVQIYTT